MTEDINEADLHSTLAKLGPFTVRLLKKHGFFEGKSLPPTFWRELKAFSLRKNAKVYDMSFSLYIMPALIDASEKVAAKYGLNR